MKFVDSYEIYYDDWWDYIDESSISFMMDCDDTDVHSDL